MRSILIASLFAITAVTAFTLPGGLADGDFVAYLDKDGQEVHEKLSTRALAAPPKVAITTRQNVVNHVTYCGCGFNMNHANCDAAVQAPKNQLPGTIGSGLSYYSIAGAAVAFACNHGYLSAYLTADMVTQSAQRVTDACGWYVAGTDLTLEMVGGIPDEIELSTGYMQYYAGVTFCANADSSSRGSC
jgi:hypothetical protein